MALPLLPGYGFNRNVSSEGALGQRSQLGSGVLGMATSLTPTVDLFPLLRLV